jgi:hypothetical protein
MSDYFHISCDGAHSIAKGLTDNSDLFKMEQEYRKYLAGDVLLNWNQVASRLHKKPSTEITRTIWVRAACAGDMFTSYCVAEDGTIQKQIVTPQYDTDGDKISGVFNSHCEPLVLNDDVWDAEDYIECTHKGMPAGMFRSNKVVTEPFKPVKFAMDVPLKESMRISDEARKEVHMHVRDHVAKCKGILINQYGTTASVKEQELLFNQLAEVVYAQGSYGAQAKEKAPKTFSFGIALEKIKDKKFVARKGWNGKSMYLFFVSDYGPRTTEVHLLYEMSPCIMMKTAQDTLVPWLASQTDMLAEDWVEVTL